jgi:hypothetical protein
MDLDMVTIGVLDFVVQAKGADSATGGFSHHQCGAQPCGRGTGVP